MNISASALSVSVLIPAGVISPVSTETEPVSIPDSATLLSVSLQRNSWPYQEDDLIAVQVWVDYGNGFTHLIGFRANGAVSADILTASAGRGIKPAKGRTLKVVYEVFGSIDTEMVVAFK